MTYKSVEIYRNFILFNKGESKPKKITPRIIVQSDAYYLVVGRQGAKEKRLMHGVAYAAIQGYEVLNVSNPLRVILNLIL